MVLPKRNKTEVGAWGGGREVMVDRSGRWGSGVDRTGHINFHVKDLGPFPSIATHLLCGLRQFAL